MWTTRLFHYQDAPTCIPSFPNPFPFGNIQFRQLLSYLTTNQSLFSNSSSPHCLSSTPRETISWCQENSLFRKVFEIFYHVVLSYPPQWPCLSNMVSLLTYQSSHKTGLSALECHSNTNNYQKSIPWSIYTVKLDFCTLNFG